MKHYEFSIGMEFMSSGGLRYRCTDIGTRTIMAISLEVTDPKLLEGPPYMQDEIVFDEIDMARCFTSHKEAILQASKKSKHPGFSSKAIKQMFSRGGDYQRYPRKNLLRLDRLYDNDVAHPYSAYQKDDGDWVILCYLIFADRPNEIAENDFLRLEIANEENFPDSGSQTESDEESLEINPFQPES